MKAVKVMGVTILASSISIGAAIFGQRWIEESPMLERLVEHGPDQLRTLPDFHLMDVQDREVASNAWAGKILVLNFWATWCTSCIDEMPMFIRAQEALREDGVQFVGIAADKAQDVREFLVDHPVSYPLLIADAEVIHMSKRLGNRLEVLPFTVIFDRRGRRVYSQIGGMTAEELRVELKPLLPESTKL
ncbi:TlpA family protein disulfide reductase [Thiorhodococcus mannitoliphagus]|uniref:TlpA family protein disulfide reductase n=1 Tax=Thiorhodococcus mannitoliphagus TaxID=329406 RepID=A0A6P1DXD7_9GAMM|nr:TlpA disulfide reductase family protein [Thiorhodococcus mannitoliphagus]NEX21753.1 TlpA family protein disulfide reductase [Thiorhodococcus mannitoliphagus]